MLICTTGPGDEEGVAASVQLRPAVRVGPASDLRAASRSASRRICQSSLAATDTPVQDIGQSIPLPEADTITGRAAPGIAGP